MIFDDPEDYDITEADETATSKRVALDNLGSIVRQGETEPMIAMFERAAWGVGATCAETEAVIREERKRRVTS